MTGTVDAILMASGASVRFGKDDKLLYSFMGKPLASYTLSLVLSFGGFNSVIFVFANPQVASLAEGSDVVMVQNRNPSRGQCESIRLGVSMASGDHYAFFPCDQPLLDDSTLRILLANVAQGGIVVPVFNGRTSSPVIFSKAFREELLSIPDGESGKWVKGRHPERVIQVAVPNGRALSDVDTPAELKRIEDTDG